MLICIFIHIFETEMTENDKNIVKWYVVGIRGTHHEVKVRDSLRQAGMYSFVPLRFEVIRMRGQLHRRTTPAISGMVFVKTSYNDFMDYALGSEHKIFLKKSAFSGYKDYLTINDSQMNLFMQLTTEYAEDVKYYRPHEVTLHEGELVEITLGTQKYEAEVKRIAGKRGKRLVVEIADVTTATITITPEAMKLITRMSGKENEARRQQREEARARKLLRSGKIDERKSRNLELDKKVLFDTAFRLLFTIPERYHQEMEYHMSMTELRRIRQRLLTFKGATAALEGELALSMYLANTKLNIETEAATERLQRAIDNLQPTSILRKRMLYYLSKFTNDNDSIQSILTEVKGWNKLRLSSRQKAFWEEIKIVEGL